MNNPDMPDLPDAKPAAQPAAPPDPDLATRPSPTAADRLVVVAEDDEGLRWIVCKWLEARGLKILGVGTGAEAIAAVREHPDCLLVVYPALRLGLAMRS